MTENSDERFLRIGMTHKCTDGRTGATPKVSNNEFELVERLTTNNNKNSKYLTKCMCIRTEMDTFGQIL